MDKGIYCGLNHPNCIYSMHTDSYIIHLHDLKLEISEIIPDKFGRVYIIYILDSKKHGFVDDVFYNQIKDQNHFRDFIFNGDSIFSMSLNNLSTIYDTLLSYGPEV